jgi:hypothetical protein
MPRFVLLAPCFALLAALLLAGPALAAFRIGTDDNETLVGTTENDQIIGKGGTDTLKGKAGNDRYFFADGFGTDTLIETTTGGTDTVNFHAVTGGGVTVELVPEWVSVNPNLNAGSGPGGQVRFGYSVNGTTVESFVENAIGGQGDFDVIQGGGRKNILQPGGGTADFFYDRGGWNDGAEGFPEVPASNDIYKGFTSNTGSDVIRDWGGTKDVLDMRPFSIEDVYVDAIDFDGSGTEESLQIVTSLTTQVVVVGQFGDNNDLQAITNFHGRIETIIFADETITDTSGSQVLAAASEAGSGKQARLAAAAEGLADEARKLAARAPEPGPLTADGGKSDDHPAADKGRKPHDTSVKHANKEKQEKKGHNAKKSSRNHGRRPQSP